MDLAILYINLGDHVAVGCSSITKNSRDKCGKGYCTLWPSMHIGTTFSSWLCDIAIPFIKFASVAI